MKIMLSNQNIRTTFAIVQKRCYLNSTKPLLYTGIVSTLNVMTEGYWFRAVPIFDGLHLEQGEGVKPKVSG